MKNFGMPYQGSKNRVAGKIVAALPPAENFVDLFFGGGAVTHAAMLSGKYTNFLANDLRKTPQAWNRLAEGIGTEYERFVPREEFLASDDIVLKMIWSFGAGCKTYACAGINETIFRLVMGATVEERYTAWRRLLKEIQGRDGNLYDDLHSVHPAYTLRWISSLKGIRRVTPSNLDYREVSIPENSTVYCDPPYEGTENYGNKFDHAAFWEWARTREFPVFISERSAPDDFVVVLEYTKQAKFNKDSGWRKEGLFVHRRFT